MPKKKPLDSRQPNKTLHIYCEGEKTEPNYLRKYIQTKFPGDQSRRVVKVEDTNKNTPKQLVEVAIHAKQSGKFLTGDEFWVVYDRESVAKYSDELHSRSRQLAEKNGIGVALSNVCFELWLLLHFEASGASYTSCDNLLAQSKLKQHLRLLGIAKYDKADSRLLDHITDDEIKKARTRAANMNLASRAAAPANCEQAHQLNPYTEVHELLDAIDAFKAKSG